MKQNNSTELSAHSFLGIYNKNGPLDPSQTPNPRFFPDIAEFSWEIGICAAILQHLANRCLIKGDTWQASGIHLRCLLKKRLDPFECSDLWHCLVGGRDSFT